MPSGLQSRNHRAVEAPSMAARPVNDAAQTEPPLGPKSAPFPAISWHLLDERQALTHHFSIAGQEGYLTVGVYEDGSPGS